MKTSLRVVAATGCLLPGIVFALGSSSTSVEDERGTRPNKFKKWRQENPPEMVIFGDSLSDVGRRFDAPASFDFEDIGPFPFKRLYDGIDSDNKIPAYMPQEGSVTNGKSWPTWLRIPDELNYATSSASASDAFRSRERCTGYTGEGEDYPTATLEEQIDRYMHEVLRMTGETLDYTHVIIIGNNDITRVGEAITRYTLGGEGYQDPVKFEDVFEVDASTGIPIFDENGLPVPTFEPAVAAVLSAWDAGIGRLIESGVTGRILLSNMFSPKGFAGTFGADAVAVLELVAQALRVGAQQIVAKYYPQVRMLDAYTLFAALVDNPSIFTDLGFTAGEGGALADSCIQFQFGVDSIAEIMGTQAGRNPDCQGECTLCADSTSPCQTCLEGNPAIFKCDDPSSRIFYDDLHFTTDFHLILGEAIRLCAKDSPNFGRPFVSELCGDSSFV